MKTKIKLRCLDKQSRLINGMRGYVDGYINIGGSPYAVVVCEGIIDIVPISSLILIKD